MMNISTSKEGLCPITGQEFHYFVDQLGVESPELTRALNARQIGQKFFGVQMKDGMVIWSERVPKHHSLIEAERADWLENVGRFQVTGGGVLKPPAISIWILRKEFPEALAGYLLGHQVTQRTRLAISHVDGFPIKRFAWTEFRGSAGEYRQRVAESGIQNPDLDILRVASPHLYGRIFAKTVGRLLPTNTITP